ncbi:exodeoxyribonuclease VII large subunit [Paracoccaceae bacterium]|nr:exodeoxyribonuclease VII large subunit [Paracoccaceae bacterium]
MAKENIPEFTVTTLSQSIKKTLETEFEYVRVKGELGRVSKPASGHIYFDLKDEKSVLASVVWRGTRIIERDLIDEGNEVVVVGRLSSFSGHSKYQIIVEDIQASGMGALIAMLNKRREKLASEGLFSRERKLNLPRYPLSIGVITSISGVVIKDILNRVEARFHVKVIIFPVTVQGDQCAKEVIEGIHFFHQQKAQSKGLRPDLLIIARGGGSFEDLWQFNDENLVRVVSEAKIPIISAIGHETDTTLIDLVADVRAPTPTAAAEIALPNRTETLGELNHLSTSLKNNVEKRTFLKMSLLNQFAAKLKSPYQNLNDMKKSLTMNVLKLDNIIKETFSMMSNRVKLLDKDLSLKLKQIFYFVSDTKKQVAFLDKDAFKHLSNTFSKKSEDLLAVSRLLESVSYKKVLSRGYSVIRDENDKIVSSKSQSKGKSALTIEWSDGKISVRTDK